jgi:long-chain fatty acid transport protein
MKFSKQLIACAVAAGLAAPMSAFATNGYFGHGYSAKSKGMAGGGSALPQDAMIAADNPAGMVKLGERMDLGLSLFSPSARGYTASQPTAPPVVPGDFVLQPGDFESDNDFFVIPHFAYNWMLNEQSSVGVSVYGNGGMNSEYPASMYQDPDGPGPAQPGVYYSGTAGVDLSQLFINASYSRKINENHSWGVSLIAAYQRFKAEGFGAFGAPPPGGFGVSNDPANLTNNGYDDSIGFGGKIGWMGTVAPGLTLAASYQTKMSMDEFSKYKGLFAENGGFDIPPTWTIGLAWNIAKTGTLTFDVQQIQYSDTKAISNPILPNLANCFFDPSAPPGASCLGGSEGAGYGWEDMTVYKLGYQWASSPAWTWRVGASYGEQPIPKSEMMFNITAPGVMETHLTGGFTYTMASNNEFTFAAMYAPEVKVKGPNQFAGFSGTSGATQDVEIYMSQWELTASWGWKF